jgi:hypothetical protein
MDAEALAGALVLHVFEHVDAFDFLDEVAAVVADQRVQVVLLEIGGVVDPERDVFVADWVLYRMHWLLCCRV